MRRLVALTLALGLVACGDDSAGPGPATDQFVVGALLSLTGAGQTLGRTSQAALELAADSINASLAAQGSPTRVSLRVQDTGLDPATALARLNALAAESVRVFIGPQSSSEVLALKPTADASGLLLLSQGSTAGALAVPGDNVFRFVPDDSAEGEATVALMWGDGVRVVVPLWREDLGNQGLHDSVKRLFEAQGGTVTAGASYAPSTTDFTAVLEALRVQVSQAAAEVGAGAVGVYLAGFEASAASILAGAAADPALPPVRWYGGDGVVQSAVVLADPTAAAFAASVAFRAPTYGLADSVIAQHQPLVDAIQARTGLAADAFTLAAYDALWVAALARARVGAGSVDSLKAELPRQADAYAGATGRTTLNAAGDRAAGDYDFYAVCSGDAGPTWRRVAAYRADGGTILPVGGC